jgi:hypothetical protein
LSMSITEACDLSTGRHAHVAPGIVNLGALTGDDDPVAVLKIADGVGKGRERNRVGADEHRALAETDRERRAFARANQQILLAGEQEGERKSPPQPRQRRLDCLDRRQPVCDPVGDQMSNDLAVGLGGELGALPFQLPAQLAEVLDDAVMHDGEPVGRVRMCVVLGRASVRGPTGVADANRAAERLEREHCFQILELAFGAPPREDTVLERRHAGRVVAAIFEALECFDELRGDRLAADDSDNAAHSSMHSPNRVAERKLRPCRRARSQRRGAAAAVGIIGAKGTGRLPSRRKPRGPKIPNLACKHRIPKD